MLCKTITRHKILLCVSGFIVIMTGCYGPIIEKKVNQLKSELSDTRNQLSSVQTKMAKLQSRISSIERRSNTTARDLSSAIVSLEIETQRLAEKLKSDSSSDYDLLNIIGTFLKIIGVLKGLLILL